MHASGRSTGVVLDSGYGVSHTVPIYEGFAIPHAIERMQIGGDDLSQHLQAMFNSERGYNFNTAADFDTVNRIKEQLCYVVGQGQYQPALKETKNAESKYDLPDGSNVSVGTERFRCSEALFNPALLNKDCKSVH